jgi:hypothetical protein
MSDAGLNRRARQETFVAAFVVLALAGCASLNPRPTDGWGTTTVKVASRVLIGIPTVGISELALASKRAEEHYQTEEAELVAQNDRWRRAALEATADDDRAAAFAKFDESREALRALRGEPARDCMSRIIGSEVVTPCE